MQQVELLHYITMAIQTRFTSSKFDENDPEDPLQLANIAQMCHDYSTVLHDYDDWAFDYSIQLGNWQHGSRIAYFQWGRTGWIVLFQLILCTCALDCFPIVWIDRPKVHLPRCLWSFYSRQCWTRTCQEYRHYSHLSNIEWLLWKYWNNFSRWYHVWHLERGSSSRSLVTLYLLPPSFQPSLHQRMVNTLMNMFKLVPTVDGVGFNSFTWQLLLSSLSLK